MNKSYQVGILTVSDRCAQGVYVDQSGPALKVALEKNNWVVVATRVLPDEENEITAQLFQWSDHKKLDVVLTTGGTGLGPRDVTPEATRVALDKELPGFSELMRRAGQTFTPLAPLSRSIAGIRGKTLIINLPGNPKGATQSLQTVEPLMSHALKMIRGEGH